MTEISATLVKQLRDRTGQAMMDCKRALGEAHGDVEKAIDILRKKGLTVLEKRGGRETKEGRLVGKVASDGRRAVLTALCSETDFTSKSDEFQRAAELLAQALLAAPQPAADAVAVGQLTVNGRKIAEVISEIVSKTGENVTLGEFFRFDLDGPGVLYAYVHFNGKVGTLVHLTAGADAIAAHPAVRTLAADLAMQVTATNPLAVSRAELPAALVARERDIAAEQIKGKPADMVEKIVAGKLAKWYQQVVLLEQPFVKDDKQTVQQLLAEAGKQAGGPVGVQRFGRVQIG